MLDGHVHDLAMKFWWCNQGNGEGWELERPAGVVCAEGNDEEGGQTFRKTVGEVKAGDVILHYKSPNVVAFSRAKENGRHYKKLPSTVPYGSGWRFETEYFDLHYPVKKDHFVKELIPRIVKYYAIKKDGNVNQGYFFPFDREGISIVLSHVNEIIPAWLSEFKADLPGDVIPSTHYSEAVPPSPEFETPPERIATQILRIIRDTPAANDLKARYEFSCQVCSLQICAAPDKYYIEVHHVRPLGHPHNGSDNHSNMLVLCPNHHAMFDFWVPRFLSPSCVSIDGKERELTMRHTLSADVLTYYERIRESRKA